MLHQHRTASVTLCPSLHIQQGLDMLQMPVADLSAFVSQQITINPCFDLDSLDSPPDSFSFFLLTTNILLPKHFPRIFFDK